MQSIANNRPRDFDIGLGKTLKLINALNPRKARGHDGISIRMHKLFNLAITKPLSITYKNCLQQGVFPDSSTPKNSKQAVNNYQPVPLAICSKIFEKLIFDIITIKITFSTTTSQDSDLMTLVYFSLLQLHITFSVLLILTLHWKSMAFLKHLIELCMTVSFMNPRVMELTVTSLNLLNRF